MQMQLAVVDPPKKFVQKSSWGKKELGDFHVDMLKFCEFGCPYCSSNNAPHLRFLPSAVRSSISEQIGHNFSPHRDGGVTIAYRDAIPSLHSELTRCRYRNDYGKTLVYSQLTDGFSPTLVSSGATRATLDLLIRHTRFRIRILTKNAVVGTDEWIRYFDYHRDRFTIGLSIGTLDDRLGQQIECGTSLPSERIAALRRLQDAGLSTYGMLCPVFRQPLMTDELEELISLLRLERCEKVWFEPYNNRRNWQQVRDAFDKQSERDWFTEVFEEKRTDLWSDYAGHLYRRVRRAADAGGWTDKIRYLLYEASMEREHMHMLKDLKGILFQSPTAEDGLSRNEAVRSVQTNNAADQNVKSFRIHKVWTEV